MSMSDPLADMLTRIRNGVMAKFDAVEMPTSKTKVNIAKVLQDEGYVTGYQISESGPQGTLTINLKYSADQTPVISGIKRISKPGLRKYARAGEIPTVLNGLGIAILSSSKGVITDKTARASNVGGEILCEVW
ncbi:MAG: 30S ribosomal protein S8 [Desulfocapsa sp.]|uniref:Small ribosomal subunit protein uS8 n=1 Tax=Desulfotalea psychrophila TaxID=84980 RepID=A0ABS3AU21_9BACT|nr:30S ribosomal protein S8 [Desulfocapsa sp.]MBN4068268.1 30S ribosomal protein S8 [Desulfotalea psychrophila]